MNKLRMLACLVVLLVATAGIAQADCVGCYDFVKVKIDLVNNKSMEGYVFKSVYGEEFVVDKSIHNSFSFLPDCITIEETKIDPAMVMDFDLDLFYVESQVQQIDSKRIKSINELSRSEHRTTAVSEYLYNKIGSTALVAYYPLGYWLFISFDNKVDNDAFQLIFSECMEGNFDDCVYEKASSLRDKILVLNSDGG